MLFTMPNLGARYTLLYFLPAPGAGGLTVKKGQVAADVLDKFPAGHWTVTAVVLVLRF
ncbi:hypothetical protein [Roseibium album]|uniref:hypothetical protein n=1 Tax=Roseibium album TaxID=311410 RepID=UPI0018CA7366|nr:hypothetical protein [Labrenzia sp. EL_195]